MKRLCTAVLTILLLVATLASCAVKTTVGAKTAGVPATVTPSASESTGETPDPPADTTATDAEPPAKDSGDVYSKNY